MNWIGSGFITIIVYSTMGYPPIGDDSLLTEMSDEILTETLQDILIES